MKASKLAFSAVIVLMPLLASSAEARSVTANQLYAAGHGKRPTFTNRPSRAIYHRHRYGRPYGFQHHYRYRQ